MKKKATVDERRNLRNCFQLWIIVRNLPILLLNLHVHNTTLIPLSSRRASSWFSCSSLSFLKCICVYRRVASETKFFRFMTFVIYIVVEDTKEKEEMREKRKRNDTRINAICERIDTNDSQRRPPCFLPLWFFVEKLSTCASTEQTHRLRHHINEMRGEISRHLNFLSCEARERECESVCACVRERESEWRLIG